MAGQGMRLSSSKLLAKSRRIWRDNIMHKAVEAAGNTDVWISGTRIVPKDF